MLLIEIYSYSLLSYTYIGLFFKGVSYTTSSYRRLRTAFILFSFVVALGVVGLIVLEILSKIKCDDKLGVGNMILSICEVPLYAVTFVYIMKTKSKIREVESAKKQSEHMQLLGNEDAYITVKLNQANFTLASFTLSLLVHVTTTIMFWAQGFSCTDGGYITVSLVEVLVLSLFDLGTLIPHLTMPYIFYFLPSKFSGEDSAIQVLPRTILRRDISEYDEYNTGASGFQAEEHFRKNLMHQRETNE